MFLYIIKATINYINSIDFSDQNLAKIWTRTSLLKSLDVGMIKMESMVVKWKKFETPRSLHPTKTW